MNYVLTISEKQIEALAQYWLSLEGGSNLVVKGFEELAVAIDIMPGIRLTADRLRRQAEKEAA